MERGIGAQVNSADRVADQDERTGDAKRLEDAVQVIRYLARAPAVPRGTARPVRRPVVGYDGRVVGYRPRDVPPGGRVTAERRLDDNRRLAAAEHGRFKPMTSYLDHCCDAVHAAPAKNSSPPNNGARYTLTVLLSGD